MIGIYKITSPKDKVYIGQSVEIERRFKQYSKLNSCNSQPKLYNSFKKYGINNHKFEVLIECETWQLNELERYYQDLYNVIEAGLNCTLTTTSSKTGRHSEETRAKISRKNKGKKHTEEFKLSISLRQKGNKNCVGRVLSAETRNKIREANSGIKSVNFGVERTTETKKRISQALKGKNTWTKGLKRSEETKKLMSDVCVHNKPVIDLKTNIIYLSLKHYCKELDLNYHAVKFHVNGRSKINKYPHVIRCKRK